MEVTWNGSQGSPMAATERQTKELESFVSLDSVVKAVLAVRNLPLAFHDPSDRVRFLAHALQHRLRFLEFRRRYHQQHPHAHVERAEHLVLRHIPELLQVLKNWKHGPGSELDH